MLSFWFRKLAGMARYNFSGGGGGSSTKTNTNVEPMGPAEIEAMQLTLNQLRRADDYAERMGPLIDQQLQDYIDKQTVLGGGKIIASFNEKDYFAANPGLEAALAGTGMTGEQHWEAHGKSEGRRGGSAVDDVATKRWQDIIDDEETKKTQGGRSAKIAARIQEEQLKLILQGGKATPEQIKEINKATGAAQQVGEANISRWQAATLRQINEEVASASGLRPTDTPIVNLSERAGEESARQQGILTSNLAGANANARLNFPLAAAGVTAGIANSQQSLALASSDFAAQLSQRATDNRFRLFNTNPYNLTPSAGFASSLQAGRLGSADRSSKTNNDMSFAEKAEGIGSLVGAGVALFGASDRRLKRDIAHIGELASGIPVYAFRYNDHEAWHIGVMADEVLPIIPEAVSEHESGYLMVRYDLLH
jgi:hypothetical protein